MKFITKNLNMTLSDITLRTNEKIQFYRMYEPMARRRRKT
jgi:hypothetical protein